MTGRTLLHPGRNHSRPLGKLVAVYKYLSPEGGECFNLPGSVVMEHVRRADPKGFTYRYPTADPRGYTTRKPPWADRLLYGLERLTGIGVIDSARYTVYWCEGEKDADAINRLNLPRVVAVSHHGGAGKATPAQAGYFGGWLGRVFVCADVDKAGAACALRRYDLLRSIGIPSGALSVVRPAGQQAKGRDVTDHLDDDHPLHELVHADVRALRARVARMSPAERVDGSGWKTGDPEVDNCDLSTWCPTAVSRRTAKS